MSEDTEGQVCPPGSMQNIAGTHPSKDKYCDLNVIKEKGNLNTPITDVRMTTWYGDFA